MSQAVDRDEVVAQLEAEWKAIDELLDGLAAGAWTAATALPGWTLADVVAHVIGTERMLAGDPSPEAPLGLDAVPHIRNPIGAANEAWVHHYRSCTPAEVLAEYRRVVGQRVEQLAGKDQAGFDEPSWTPAGQATYGRFMQIRLFDCWLHEQDIRDTLGRPGHEDGPCAEGALGEVVRSLGYVVGKLGGAPDGSLVTIELTGPLTHTLHVAVDGRAAVVPVADRPPTTTLRLGSSLFVRLAGGRVDPAARLAEVAIEGDQEVGRRIATHLAFTI
ncbi:MAG: maleylpyruvate isomerase family mycothiol-dependent enzyme [Acidimicrobiales bacterium]